MKTFVFVIARAPSDDSVQEGELLNMTLSALYGFHGSANIYLTFEQDKNDSIRLKTDYGEIIAVARNLSELKRVIDDLAANKYAE